MKLDSHLQSLCNEMPKLESGQRMILGIDGLSRSGKTTYVHKLSQLLKLTTSVCIFHYINKSSREFEKVIYSDIPFPDKIKKLIFNKKEVANKINDEFYQYLMKEYSAQENYIEKLFAEKAIPYLTLLFKQGKEQGFIDENLSEEAILFYIHMLKEYIQREEVYTKILPLTEDITNIFFYGIVGKGDERLNS